MHASRNIQEGLCALIWHSSKFASQAIAALSVSKYDKVFRDIAKAGILYFETYGEVAGDHAIDLVDDLVRDNPESEKIYRAITDSMLGSLDGLRPAFLLDRASDVENMAQMREGIQQAAMALQDGKPDSMLQAREALSSAIDLKDSGAFDLGTSLFAQADRNRVFAALDEENEAFRCGIPEIDKYGFGPARGQLHLYVGLPKTGKSWWLTHLAKQGHLANLKVLYISMEMSEMQVNQRLMMAMASVAKRPGDIKHHTFSNAEDPKNRGLHRGIDYITNRPTWEDDDIRATMGTFLDSRSRYEEVRVKSFPTNSLSVQGMEAFLDRLEASEGFVPDLLLVDYADIMQLPNNSEHRHAVGTLYKELRRVAGERHLAIATATQAGRSSKNQARMDDTSVSEDYSKIFTADTVITYNQTDWEQRMNLARLYLAAGRGDRDKFEVLISQAYGIGQYCLDSILVGSGYKKELSLQGERGD